MLTITRTAAQAIESVVAAGGSLGEEGGIRITHEPVAGERTGMTLTVAPAPETDDQVVVEEGARVFLPPDTAALLDDKVLDARIEGTSVGFQLFDQS